MSDDSNHEKSLSRVMVVSTAISFGLLAAAVASTKDFFGGNVELRFSPLTIPAFLAGTFAGWIFWQVVRRCARKK